MCATEAHRDHVALLCGQRRQTVRDGLALLSEDVVGTHPVPRLLVAHTHTRSVAAQRPITGKPD